MTATLEAEQGDIREARKLDAGATLVPLTQADLACLQLATKHKPHYRTRSARTAIRTPGDPETRVDVA